MNTTYQGKILSFGQKLGKSRWFAVFLLFIGISYFAKFMASALNIYQVVDSPTFLNILNAAGFLVFSLSTTYVSIVLLMSRDIKSRRLFLLLSIAAIWGGFSDLMKIYPWNIVIAIFFLIVVRSLSRKSVWELLQKKWAEKKQN